MTDEVKALKKRIHELENRDPLRDNDLLLRAAEYILQACLLKSRRTDFVRRSRLSDPEYRKKFIGLLLDPRMNAAKMARELGVTYPTVRKQIQILTGEVEREVSGGYRLRTRDVGSGIANDYDHEEQDWFTG